LQFQRIGVIDVIAETTVKGDHMITATEEAGTAQAATEKPIANKKASVGQERAHGAPKKGKAAKKTKAPKKTSKAAKKRVPPGMAARPRRFSNC
jgi:hypothetical protein